MKAELVILTFCESVIHSPHFFSLLALLLGDPENWRIVETGWWQPTRIGIGHADAKS